MAVLHKSYHDSISTSIYMDYMDDAMTVYLYCHGLNNPLIPYSDDRRLNHFTFVMPCELDKTHNNKHIYYGEETLSSKEVDPLDNR